MYFTHNAKNVECDVTDGNNDVRRDRCGFRVGEAVLL